MTGRALVVTQAFPPEMGGNASRIGDTATHLAAEGWDVTVLAPHPCYPPGQFSRSWSPWAIEERDGVTVYRLWAWQPTDEDPGFVQRMAYYLTFAVSALVWVLFVGRRFDVLLTSTPPIFTGVPGLAGAVVHDVPWVVDVRDLWIEASAELDFITPGGALARLSHRYQRTVLSTAERVLTTTPEMRSKLVSRYDSLDSDVAAVIPNGVDASRFDVAVDSTERRVVYAGNLGHAQNLGRCIRAMEYVESDLSLLIVGDGDRRSDLQQSVETLDLQDVVTLAGPVEREEVPRLLESSLLGVAPIRVSDEFSYAVPTKAYEYMACRLPVVATGTGAIERLMDSSNGGVVVDEDPRELAAAFDELATDDDRRERFARDGHRYVVEHRDRRKIAGKLSDELRELLERDAEPGASSARKTSVERRASADRDSEQGDSVCRRSNGGSKDESIESRSEDG